MKMLLTTVYSLIRDSVYEDRKLWPNQCRPRPMSCSAGAGPGNLAFAGIASPRRLDRRAMEVSAAIDHNIYSAAAATAVSSRSQIRKAANAASNLPRPIACHTSATRSDRPEIVVANPAASSKAPFSLIK
jgi:hypothetical protein